MIERLRLAARPAGELAEARIHGGAGARIGGREVEVAPLQLLQPIVLGRFELDSVSMRSSISADEGREQLAVQPVAIEIARAAVRRGDDHHVAREEMLEQAAEDHGVGDVGHFELVEAEKRRVARDLGRGAADRIGGGFAAPLDRLMRLGHELLEVHAALRRVVDGVEEEVEQHGLAAPDARHRDRAPQAPSAAAAPNGRRRRRRGSL